MTILDYPILQRIRRNHGLEHATLNIFNQIHPYRRLAGYSFYGGFFILGEITTNELRSAVERAMRRMSSGERHLAIHAGCGTNLATSSFIAGLLAWLGMSGAKGKREKVERLPLVIALTTLGLIVGQPLGLKIQERITTSGDPQGLSLVDIIPMRFGRLTLHRVVTKSL